MQCKPDTKQPIHRYVFLDCVKGRFRWAPPEREHRGRQRRLRLRLRLLPRRALEPHQAHRGEAHRRLRVHRLQGRDADKQGAGQLNTFDIHNCSSKKSSKTLFSWCFSASQFFWPTQPEKRNQHLYGHACVGVRVHLVHAVPSIFSRSPITHVPLWGVPLIQWRKIQIRSTRSPPPTFMRGGLNALFEIETRNLLRYHKVPIWHTNRFMAPDILSGRKKLEGSFLLSLPLISEIENFRSLNW